MLQLWCNIVLSYTLPHFAHYYIDPQINTITHFPMLNTTSMIAYGTPHIGRPSYYDVWKDNSQGEEHFNAMNGDLQFFLQKCTKRFEINKTKAVPRRLLLRWFMGYNTRIFWFFICYSLFPCFYTTYMTYFLKSSSIFQSQKYLLFLSLSLSFTLSLSLSLIYSFFLSYAWLTTNHAENINSGTYLYHKHLRKRSHCSRTF